MASEESSGLSPGAIIILFFCLSCFCCCCVTPILLKLFGKQDTGIVEQVAGKDAVVGGNDYKPMDVSEILARRDKTELARQEEERAKAIEEAAAKGPCTLLCANGELDKDICKCVNCSYNCQVGVRQDDCTCKCPGNWTGSMCSICPSNVPGTCSTWAPYVESKCKCDTIKDHPANPKVAPYESKTYRLHLQASGVDACVGVKVNDLATLDYHLQLLTCGEDFTKWKFEEVPEYKGTYYMKLNIVAPEVYLVYHEDTASGSQVTAFKGIKLVPKGSVRGGKSRPGYRWKFVHDPLGKKVYVKTSDGAYHLGYNNSHNLAVTTRSIAWLLERA